MESLEAQLLRLEKEPQNPDLINQLFRTAHTLKGSAYTVGFQSIGDLTHYIEDFMGAVRESRVKVLPGHTDVLLRSVDVVRLLMRRDPTLTGTVRQRFAAAMTALKQLEQTKMVETVAKAAPVQPMPEPVVEQALQQPEPEQVKVRDAAGEEREVIRVSRDRLERLLNLVGELVIGRGRLEQRLSVLEQLSQQVLACRVRLIRLCALLRRKAYVHTADLSKRTGGSGKGCAGSCDVPGTERFRQSRIRQIRRLQHSGPAHQRSHGGHLRIDDAVERLDPRGRTTT